MAILNEDNRSLVENFNLDGIDSVVAVDFSLPENNEGEVELSDGGTGNLIGPNHVLTAGHVIFGEEGVKVSTGENAADLPTRTQRLLSSEDFNATDFSYPAPGYDGNDRSGIGGKDLGLITLDQQIGEPSQYIGLAAFVDPQDADNLQVTTAGFPGVVEVGDFSTNDDGSLNIDASISKNTPFLITDENDAPSIFVFKGSNGSYLTDAVKMFTASGTIDNVDSDGQFSLDETLDAEAGQSGSGYWTYLEGDTEPRLLGVYSAGGDTNFGITEDNIGALISTEAYDNIVATMEPSLDANNLTGNDLPENAIVGSDENDNIKGSYRRERILGNEGQDTISGGGADDRLEGGAGYDILKGEKGNDRLQGDGANDSLDGGEGDNDIAVFSDEFENYDYSELTGSTFGVAESGLITIEHVDGTYADGKDTLVGIEWAQFQDQKENLAGTSGTEESSNQAIITQEEPQTVTRVIPLPLEDGVEETNSVEVTDTTTNPNLSDPPTPPNVSINAPVAMLDGDVDYTVTISPYQPDTAYNITYIIDTSYSMQSRGNLQPTKDAYTDLTNYFIDNELAENINFNVVQFSRNATSYNNLTATEAISTIENLTTASGSEGTKYNEGLYQGFNSIAQSSLDIDGTNIAYFVSDGKSQTNYFDPYDQTYHQDAQLLRSVA